MEEAHLEREMDNGDEEGDERGREMECGGGE